MRRAIVFCVLLAACGKGAPPPAEKAAPIPEPPADAITKETDTGPAKVSVKVWPAKPTLGDSIWLRLDVETDVGVTADLPFDQQALGRFEVLRYVPDQGKTKDGGEHHVDVYELAAPMSGRHRIPPLRVVVHAPGTGSGSASESEVLTDEIPLEVGTVLAEKTDQALHATRASLDVYVGRRSPWPLIALGAGGLAALGALAGGFVLLRKRQARQRQVGAWELAISRLRDLEARGAPAPDDAAACDAWFVDLSAIVRSYVEGRFTLRAPELTTEEFLTEARRIPALGDGHRDLLGSFLERCDRVKFAGWRPAAGESLELLGVARAFVTETRPAEDPGRALATAEVVS